jgi:hypothetical protein
VLVVRFSLRQTPSVRRLYSFFGSSLTSQQPHWHWLALPLAQGRQQ